MLELFRVLLNQSDTKTFWAMLGCPSRLTEQLERTEARLNNDRRKFLEQLKKDQTELSESFDGFDEKVQKIKMLGDLDNVEEVCCVCILFFAFTSLV